MEPRNLDPMPFPAPRQGMFDLVVGGHGFTVHVDFPSGKTPERVTITWTSCPAEQP